MKLLLQKGRERSWYLVKEWTTKAGLPARIQQCVWNGSVAGLAPSLHNFYTGYVKKRSGDTAVYTGSKIDVHGGVTFEGKLRDVGGSWVGFDMAHLGDKNRQSLGYATKECENLAKQLVAQNATKEKRTKAWAIIWDPGTLSLRHIHKTKKAAQNAVKGKGNGTISPCIITYTVPRKGRK